MKNKKVRELIPTLIVGLGGTGYKALKLIKKSFLESTYYNHKVPPMLKFLSFDTDANLESKKDEEVLTKSEKILLSVDSTEILANLHQHPHIEKWFPLGRVSQTIAHGARQIRALGRLSIFSNIDNIIRFHLSEAIRSITDKKLLSLTADSNEIQFKRTADNIPINVFVVSSVSGGTGAGMVTDMPYIVRQMIANEKFSSEVHGYLFLPDSFVDIKPVDRERLIANGAAALKELDLFMEGLEKFSTRYSDGFAINPNTIGSLPPFNFAYLISGVGINDQNTIMKTVVEQIFHSFGTALTKDSKSYLANIPTNAFKSISGGDFKGKKTNYSSLGVAICSLPVDKLIESFSNRFAADLMNAILEYDNPKSSNKESPWQKDVLLFMRENDIELNSKNELAFLEKLIDINKAFKATTTNFSSFSVNKLGDVMLENVQISDKTYHDIIKELQTSKEKISNFLINNYANLVNHCMGDANRGVIFAIKSSEMIFAHVEQYANKLSRELEVKQKEMENFSNIARDKKLTFEAESSKSWLFRMKDQEFYALVDEWMSYQNSAYKTRLQIDCREEALAILKKLMVKINEISKKLEAFNKAVESMQNMFTKNSNFVSWLSEAGESDWLLNNYSFITAPDVERLYSKYVGKTGTYETNFIGDKGLDLKNGAKWITYAENPNMFEEDVKTYSKKILSAELMKLTIEEFLTEKSSITGEDEIKIVGEALANTGKTLWQINKGIYPGHLVPLNLIGVYDSETSKIPEHIQNILKQDSQVVTTKDPHKITLIQSEHGAPLFALSPIMDWENFYNKYNESEFLHAVTEEEYKIMWDNYPFRPITVNQTEGIKMYMLAIKFKYIKVKGQKFYCVFDPADEITPGSAVELGGDHLSAFNTFLSEKNYRKVKHLVERSFKELGSYDKKHDFIKNCKDSFVSFLKKNKETCSKELIEVFVTGLRSLASLETELAKKCKEISGQFEIFEQ